MNITIEDVQKKSDIIFNYLVENYTEKIEIEDDLCWFIQKDELFSIIDNPQNCTLASIYDAIEHLSSLESANHVPTAHSLKMLSILLRYISEKIVI